MNVPFPTPASTYDRENEAQFRATVQRALQDAAKGTAAGGAVPSSHAAAHHAGGTDQLTLDNLYGGLDAGKLFGDLSVDLVAAPVVTTGFLVVDSFAELADVEILGFLDVQQVNATTVALSGMAPLTVPVGAGLIANLDVDKVDGQHGAFYLSRTNHTGTLSFSGMPTGSGSWDTGSGTILTIARGLTVTGATVLSSVLTAGTTGGSNTLKGETRFEGAATTSNTESFFVTGDAVLRGVTKADASKEWGSGAASRDTRLRRSGVSTLTIDTPAGAAANLVVTGQLRMATTAATTLGTVVAKRAAYDASGTYIGDMPIYNTIT